MDLKATSDSSVGRAPKISSLLETHFLRALGQTIMETSAPKKKKHVRNIHFFDRRLSEHHEKVKDTINSRLAERLSCENSQSQGKEASARIVQTCSGEK